MLLVGGWLRWPGDCSTSRLTALLLGRLLRVLLFTEARSMGRAVQWSPMKPESWSGWFPLKYSPTCSYRWLHCDLQNVLREHSNCTAGTVRSNRSEASWQLTWLSGRTELRRLLNYLEADPSENTARNNTCCDCWLPCKSCLSECCLDTNLRYLVTEVLIIWEVSMRGSYNFILNHTTCFGRYGHHHVLKLYPGSSTYDRPHLGPQKLKFFCDPILFVICTSKIINKWIN
jgi:hypothetical protein